MLETASEQHYPIYLVRMLIGLKASSFIGPGKTYIFSVSQVTNTQAQGVRLGEDIIRFKGIFR